MVSKVSTYCDNYWYRFPGVKPILEKKDLVFSDGKNILIGQFDPATQKIWSRSRTGLFEDVTLSVTWWMIVRPPPLAPVLKRRS